MQKMQTVKKIAAALQAARVTWGIGGDVLLYHNGIVFDFVEFVFFALPQHAAAAKAALYALGEEILPEAKAPRDAYCSTDYAIDGLICRLVTQFCVQDDTMDYRYFLAQSSIAETAHCEVELPYMALEDWYLFYALTQQSEKIQLLQRHFLFNGIGCPSVFTAAQTAALPPCIKAELALLLEKDEQPKMWD